MSGPSICVNLFVITKCQVWDLAAEYAEVRLSLFGDEFGTINTLNTVSCKFAKIGAMLCRLHQLFHFVKFVDNENTSRYHPYYY